MTDLKADLVVANNNNMVPLSKGLLAYCFLYSSYRLFDSSDRAGMGFVLHPLGIYILEDVPCSRNPP